jgi:acetyltransferase-like isoleucine patch superfamily enzyme
MSEGFSIVIPREIVNDDQVTIVEWLVRPGDYVKKGDVVLEVETSKANISIEAEADGYIEILHPVGAEVAVGEEVGRLLSHPPVGPAAPHAPSPHSVAASDQRISRKALALMEEKGLDAAAFAGLPLVREEDVRRYLEQREDGIKAEQPPDERAATAAAQAGPKTGLFGDARASAGERGRSVLWLACNYLFRNYLLGLLVRVAPRGVILALHRLRGVKIGEQCYIDPTAIVETAYPENVTIGNDVRVTAHAVIMTHIKGPHYLRETGAVPVILKEVILEDHCFIGVNAVIMPGVTVGKASVVASGAVVFNAVPPHTMVAGNPAQVVKRFPVPEQERG